VRLEPPPGASPNDSRKVPMQSLYMPDVVFFASEAAMMAFAVDLRTTKKICPVMLLSLMSIEFILPSEALTGTLLARGVRLVVVLSFGTRMTWNMSASSSPLYRIGCLTSTLSAIKRRDALSWKLFRFALSYPPDAIVR
jgi:hypothetical protein